MTELAPLHCGCSGHCPGFGGGTSNPEFWLPLTDRAKLGAGVSGAGVVFDHPIFGTGWMTFQPYELPFRDLGELIERGRRSGLSILLQPDSPHLPGSTFFVVVLVSDPASWQRATETYRAVVDGKDMADVGELRGMSLGAADVAALEGSATARIAALLTAARAATIHAGVAPPPGRTSACPWPVVDHLPFA